MLAVALAAPHVQAQEAGLVLEEIIVTAQKRVETLSDTPMTVNVVTGEQIGEFAAFSFEDFNNLTAGLAISGNNFDTDIATRGLGTDLNAPISPRVTTYLDGAFIAQQRGLFSGIYDLSQFELLRGPQGTLYGQTSPAGAITIRTTNPNLEEVDGYIQQGFTEYDGSNTQAGVSIPLIPGQLGIRIAGLYDTNENSDADNITLGDSLENETTAFRVVALWEPTDDFSLRLSYHDIEDEFDIDPVVRGDGIDFDDRVAIADFDSEMENLTDIFIAEANYVFDNGWNATLVASQQDNKVTRAWDDDGSAILGSNQVVISDVPDTESVEFLLASQEGDFWNWTAGVFYQDSDTDTPVFADTYTAVGPTFTTLTKTTGPAIISGEIWALFTHNTFYVTENGTLTVGLRYNEEESESTQTFTNTIFSVNPDGSETELTSFQFEGVLPEDQVVDDDAWTGTLKYQHRFDDIMVYGSYDRGWRRGAANIAGRPNPPVFGAFDAEDSDNLELGFKWDLWEGRALWNMAVYYQVYTDFQYQAESVEFVDLEGITLASPVVNVDEAESYGFDSDMTVLLSENWSLRAALSYNQTEFSDAEDVPCTSDEPLGDELFSFNTCNLNGERAGQEPEWSGNLSSEYWGEAGFADSEWYLRGLFNAESEYFSNSEQADLDSYATVDLFVGLRGEGARWDVSVWMKNVFDESAELKTERRGQVPDYDNGGAIDPGLVWVRRQLNPRTLGATLAYRF